MRKTAIRNRGRSSPTGAPWFASSPREFRYCVSDELGGSGKIHRPSLKTSVGGAIRTLETAPSGPSRGSGNCRAGPPNRLQTLSDSRSLRERRIRRVRSRRHKTWSSRLRRDLVCRLIKSADYKKATPTVSARSLARLTCSQ